MAETNQWICPTCSTKIFNLDKCWNCHTYRPGVQPPATEALKAEDAISTGLLLDGSEASEPSNQENKNMLIRYQDGYRVAKVIQGFGEACKVLGIVLGVLIAIAGGNASSISNFMLVIGLVVGAIVGFVGWAIGVLISAQGQLLQATLDTAVNSSPFLSNNQRAKIMSLP